MEGVKRKMEKERSAVGETLGLDSVKLETNSQHGYFFRITRKVVILTCD